MSELAEIRPKLSDLPSNYQYRYAFDDWLLLWDAYMGEREVKEQGTTYLPKTVPMQQASDGAEHYNVYKQRSVYFNYIKETILGMYGLLWQRPIQVKVPPVLEDWLKNCSITGNTFEEEYRKVTFNQLWKGRYGILLDIPADGTSNENQLPQIVQYQAESIVDWGTTYYKGKLVLKYVLLDQSINIMSDIEENDDEAVEETKWLLCALQTHDENNNELPEATYYIKQGQGAFNSEDLTDITDAVVPQYKGKTLSYIPFIFVNASNNNYDIEKPPLQQLASLCIAIYRGDADYREALFKQGQATLFGAGFESDSKIFTGASALVSTSEPDAKLEFVEVSGAGLTSMREAEQDLKETAVELGISLLQKSSGDETGASVSKHITIRTATLKTIASTAATTMMTVLAVVLDWIDSSDSFSIIPNLDYSISTADADAFLKMSQAYDTGKITKRDFYEWQKKNEFTVYSSFDEWLIEFEKQETLQKEKDVNNTNTSI